MALLWLRQCTFFRAIILGQLGDPARSFMSATVASLPFPYCSLVRVLIRIAIECQAEPQSV